MNKNVQRGLLAAGVLMGAGVAQAAAGDPDVSVVTAAAASVAVVGAAVFSVNVGVKLWKWFRSAL